MCIVFAVPLALLDLWYPERSWHCSVPFILLTSRPLLLPVILRLVVACCCCCFSSSHGHTPCQSYSLPEFCALSAKVSFRIQLNNKRSHFPEPSFIFSQNRIAFFFVVARSGNFLQNSACCFKSNAHVLPTGTQGMLRCLLWNTQSITHLIEWFAVSTGQQDCQVPGTG